MRTFLLKILASNIKDISWSAFHHSGHVFPLSQDSLRNKECRSLSPWRRKDHISVGKDAAAQVGVGNIFASEKLPTS